MVAILQQLAQFVGMMTLVPTVITSVLIFWSLRTFRRTMKLRHIPTAGGPSLPILSYAGAMRGFFNDKKLVEEGYAKYNGRPFKIATLSGWSVIISGPRMVDELCKAGDSKLSFTKGIDQVLQMEHTINQRSDDAYHVNVIWKQLKLNLDAIFPAMYDEITSTFDDNVAAVSEWTAYPAFELAKELTSRTYGRISVGTPLCRDKDYIALNKQLTVDMMVGGSIVRSVPSELKPLAGRFLSVLQSYSRRLTKHIGPLIMERLSLLEQYGTKWDGRPNDILQWLIDAAPSEDKLTIPQLVKHMMRIGNAAVLSPAGTFSQALLHLVAHPQYIEPLREEVVAALKEHGWTRKAISEMHKLDSFYRETQRVAILGNTLIFRVAVQDFTFSDGTFIPEGTFVAVAAREMHTDEKIYPGAKDFNPFRFSSTREENDGTEALESRYTMAGLGPSHIPFGYGKHACPGRFLAALELKAMLAYVLVKYDIRAEQEGIPAPRALTQAARTMKVEFRGRRV